MRMTRFWWQCLSIVTMGLVLAILPLGVRSSAYTMHLLILSMLWAGLASAWDMLLSYAGVFNLGQLAFFAIGAYASGMVTVHLGVSPWLGLVVGAAFGALFGVLVGLPCLRLKGIYVALMTLAFYECVGPIIVATKGLGTGGWAGLFPIPPFSLGGHTFNYDDLTPWYYVALVLFVIAVVVVVMVINSSLGTSFMALRDSEAFAESLGVRRYRASLLVVAISASVTGLLGAFYATYSGVVSPRLMGLDLFLFLVVMIILGGAGRFPGPVIGAFAVTFLDDSLRAFGTARLLVLGAIVLGVVLLMPSGIAGALESAVGLVRRLRHGTTPAAAVEFDPPTSAENGD